VFIVAKNCSTQSVATAVREYEGVTRKHAICEIVRSLQLDSSDVVASFGEDAAVIRQGETALLLAADGIWNKLMEADPYWAGFCGVLVNIHDIAAMGGDALAMVDILSFTDDQLMQEVTRGMADAARRFGVPIVGGHLHPNTPYNVIDIAILGTTRLDCVIYSDRAEDGDAIIAAIDLNGRVHPSCAMNWDSVTMKDSEILRSQVRVMKSLGEDHLITAAKDISNPGIIGTLGMLLEVSMKGAEIELHAIPMPDLEANGITFEHWIKMYPGMGFILTAKQEHVDEVCRRFRKVGMAAQVIGTVNETRELTVSYQGDTTEVFDFSVDGIMGPSKDRI
jgi:hypothetical protein